MPPGVSMNCESGARGRFVVALLVLVSFPHTSYAREVAYKLIEEKIQDTPIKTQIEQQFVAVGVPTQRGLKSEVLKRYHGAIARRGFRYHNPATSVYIYIYGSKEQARSGNGLWIAMIGKNFSDCSEPEAVIDQDRLSALTEKPNERFGLSTAARKKIFWDMVAAEDQATKDSESGDVQGSDQFQVEQRLSVKYKMQVARRYGLTQQQLEKIAGEGLRKGWPMP